MSLLCSVIKDVFPRFMRVPASESPVAVAELGKCEWDRKYSLLKIYCFNIYCNLTNEIRSKVPYRYISLSKVPYISPYTTMYVDMYFKLFSAAETIQNMLHCFVTSGTKTNTTFKVESDPENKWWQLQERTWKETLYTPGDCCYDKESLTIVTFNDRVAPAGLSFFTGYG